MKKIIVQLHSGRQITVTGEDIEIVESSHHVVVVDREGEIAFDAHEGNVEYYTCETVDG